MLEQNPTGEPYSLFSEYLVGIAVGLTLAALGWLWHTANKKRKERKAPKQQGTRVVGTPPDPYEHLWHEHKRY